MCWLSGYSRRAVRTPIVYVVYCVCNRPAQHADPLTDSISSMQGNDVGMLLNGVGALCTVQGSTAGIEDSR